MPVDPDKALVPARSTLARQPHLAWGVFCASPTVLEAINGVLHRQGLATLRVLDDGTIAPTDPLLLRVEYVPSPFVW